MAEQANFLFADFHSVSEKFASVDKRITPCKGEKSPYKWIARAYRLVK
jgi:prepilin-type processing-associated H-X9-DG protein